MSTPLTLQWSMAHFGSLLPLLPALKGKGDPMVGGSQRVIKLLEHAVKRTNNETLTLFFHADISAAQQTTSLTLATHPHVHLTATSVLAQVLRITSYAASEKPCTHVHTDAHASE